MYIIHLFNIYVLFIMFVYMKNQLALVLVRNLVSSLQGDVGLPHCLLVLFWLGLELVNEIFLELLEWLLLCHSEGVNTGAVVWVWPIQFIANLTVLVRNTDCTTGVQTTRLWTFPNLKKWRSWFISLAI